MKNKLKNAQKEIFFNLSKKAVLAAKEEMPELKKFWDISNRVIPGFGEHFNDAVLTEEAELRVRLLICAEANFVEKVAGALFVGGKKWNYLDIGDSDGTTRLLLKEALGKGFDSLGVNLQKKAVDKIKSKGLDAECVDAMSMGRSGRKFNLVSLFETLEHLPDPVGFLKSIQNVVGDRLIISVPLIRGSRVGLRYLDKDWPADKIPTIENVHIFELSPADWKRIFLHSGWGVDKEWELRQYPSRGVLKHIMQFAWRRISFEGFWFVSLKKDSCFVDRFRVE